jgi:hypothetical protein
MKTYYVTLAYCNNNEYPVEDQDLFCTIVKARDEDMAVRKASNRWKPNGPWEIVNVTMQKSKTEKIVPAFQTIQEMRRNIQSLI